MDATPQQLAGLNLKDLEPATDIGARPTFEWIPKDWLYVDPTYQRGTNSAGSRSLIRKIVEEFAWKKFQPITVTERDDGRYNVIDGQHRAVSAIMHPAVEDVPCWIVEASDSRAQARVFLSVNEDRNPVQPLQAYKAALTAQEPDALQIDKVCREAGVTLAYTLPGASGKLPPRQTQAVSTIRKLLFQHGEGPVSAALKALVEAYPDTPNQLRGQVISAVTTVFTKHRDRLDRDRLVRVLVDMDCEDLIEAARAIKKLMGGSTQAGMVEALLRNYDKGLPMERRLGKGGPT